MATETERFRDRADAGRRLGERLREYAGRDDVIVLGLPRGGIPVAFEVARALDAPLDVFVVRKLRVPGDEDLSFGAVATGGTRVLLKGVVEALDIPSEWIEAVDAEERRELERLERDYRGDRPPPDLTAKVVILVDDGVTTGATMTAAVQAARLEDPARIVVAAPVADAAACDELRTLADEVVCLRTPKPLRSVGEWYEDFAIPRDEDLRRLLEQARPAAPATGVGLVRALDGAAGDYDDVVERAAATDFALIGEASHGTHEFYAARAEMTRRLIVEQGYTLVAVEADWPDAYRVNRFVRGEGDDEDADEALGDFRRFPLWMWRNTAVAEFVLWLREHNDGLPPGAPKVGFYGLDLYSLHTSMHEVIAYLEDIDPAAAERARQRYGCFDHFGRDPQVYAYETGLGGAEACERQAVEQLVELHDIAAKRFGADGEVDDDRHFYAEQNARLVVDAERYYRAMFRGGITTWNMRDTHMADTLDALVDHLGRRRGQRPKAVVWAHNSHVGDARATELGQSGELNVGQLVRERHGRDNALVVGFTTYTGTVTAASDWDGDPERKLVRRALPGSWEDLFHEAELERALIDARRTPGRRLERAIGVVYRPETERISHYFHARLAEQFDLVVHFDDTHALEPLERTGAWETGEVPEMYPWGV
jgi:erythromycin esterase-like protein/predicted phosphoribosyltransferase